MSFAIHTICDAAVAKAEPHHYPPRRPNFILATTILASSLAFIDGSVVNVGLPAISATFHAGAEDLQWVINAYLLPLSALLLLAGERHKPRRRSACPPAPRHDRKRAACRPSDRSIFHRQRATRGLINGTPDLVARP